MNLSANSLFHFTSNLEAIESIIHDKFYGGYCKEVLYNKEEKIPLYIPMISFCDIRLETISRFSKYGKYGIGLKKDWGIRNKLNPVFYLEKESLLAESMIKSIVGSFLSVLADQDKINQLKDRIEKTNKPGQRTKSQQISILSNIQKQLNILKIKSAPFEHLIYSIYYTKHYQADLEREDGLTKDYRFYDEREWRYMPKFDCAVCQLRRTEKEYLEWRGISEKKPLLREVALSFDYSDIEHIIVEKEVEIEKMIDIIKKISNDKCSQMIKERLLTKITSFEKIGTDF